MPGYKNKNGKYKQQRWHDPENIMFLEGRGGKNGDATTRIIPCTFERKRFSSKLLLMHLSENSCNVGKMLSLDWR